MLMFPVTACVLSCTQYLGYTCELLLLYITWLAYYIRWLVYNLVSGVTFTRIKYITVKYTMIMWKKIHNSSEDQYFECLEKNILNLLYGMVISVFKAVFNDYS